MYTDVEIEEFLPCPLKIKLGMDGENYIEQVGGQIKDLRLSFNEERQINIEPIRISFNNLDLYEDKFEILISNEKVMEGSLNPEELKGLVTIVKSILELWCERIITAQNENEKKCYEYEREGKYELLYEYYDMRGEGDKAFHFLKKLSVLTSRFDEELFHMYNKKSKKDRSYLAIVKKTRSKIYFD